MRPRVIAAGSALLSARRLVIAWAKMIFKDRHERPACAAALHMSKRLVKRHPAVPAQPCDSECRSAIEAGVAMEIDALAITDQCLEIGERRDQPRRDIIGAAVL